MEHGTLGSTRFLYKQDTQLLAEIEVVTVEKSLYKFIIYPTKLGSHYSDFLSTDVFDSFRLSQSFPNIRGTYDHQFECLRAATRLLSSMAPRSA